MIRYTKGGNRIISDIIGSENGCDLQAGGVRPVWVEVNIPPSAKPGVYKGKVVVSAESGSPVSIPVILEVAPEFLPAPSNWQVHLDLWQHPQAVARWHDVEPWSPEHFALMKPVMKRLADAGQKAITCSLIDEAWNAQTYDWFPPMIEWIKGRNGTMRWNYANFDKWVSFMINEVGIKGQISCYTMIPWNMKIRYLDEATGKYKFLDLKPNDPSYEAIWGPFLTDFRKHVKSKGWLDKTCIGLDERPDAMVKAAKNVLDKYAPEFKIVSAVNRPTAMTRHVYDVSPVLDHADTVTSDLLAQRKKEGKKTTFYVCVYPKKPNTFTISPLAEAEWLPLFAAANHLDGFLRWAYNSWNRNPFEKPTSATGLRETATWFIPATSVPCGLKSSATGWKNLKRLISCAPAPRRIRRRKPPWPAWMRSFPNSSQWKEAAAIPMRMTCARPVKSSGRRQKPLDDFIDSVFPHLYLIESLFLSFRLPETTDRLFIVLSPMERGQYSKYSSCFSL